MNILQKTLKYGKLLVGQGAGEEAGCRSHLPFDKL